MNAFLFLKRNAGACGGELACATCHLIFEQTMYDTLPLKEPEEDDMLDLAFELTDTWVQRQQEIDAYVCETCCVQCSAKLLSHRRSSRLGCQICVRGDMGGMKVRIPKDGF